MKDIISQINNHSVVYISNEVEHGLLLQDLLENYSQICLNSNDIVDYLKDEGKNVTCFKKEFNEDVKSSADLLSLSISKGIIKGNSVQTFKTSRKFERLVSENNFISLNNSFALNSKFEQKISQANIFRDIGLSVPKTIVAKLITVTHQYLVSQLGENYVVQFNRGHTGLGTSFIKTENDFNDLVQKFPNREIRAMKYVKGDTYTINCCMTKHGIIAGGISKQITGVKELTAFSGGTVGNNFNHDLSEEQISQLKDEFTKLSMILYSSGYKGLFGLDFMIDNDKVVIIEMNARQTMSVNFHGQLQLLQNQTPLILFHIAEFLNINFDLDMEEYNSECMLPIEAGQLFLRNLNNEIYEVSKSQLTGVYKQGEKYDSFKSGLYRRKKSFRIKDLEKDEVMILTQLVGNKIKMNGEVGRIQVLNDLYEDGEISAGYIDILLNLYK